ncbi:hypothetical protein [Escherichia coli]
MTTDITELALMKGQKVEAPYYLAECTECGKMYSSSKLIASRNYFDGDADCYCPHCNAEDADIADLGSGEQPAVMAWNYQQARIDVLVEALEKAQAKATQQGNIACALFDEVTQLRLHADEKAPELRAQLIEADSELEALRNRIAELESHKAALLKFIRDSCYVFDGADEDISDAYVDAITSGLIPKLESVTACNPPLFWVRVKSDGGYEGPIHDSKLEEVRKKSGEWLPLTLAGGIPELESRTVTVKLPERYACELGYNAPDPSGDMLDRDDVLAMLADAGIKVEDE